MEHSGLWVRPIYSLRAFSYQINGANIAISLRFFVSCWASLDSCWINFTWIDLNLCLKLFIIYALGMLQQCIEKRWFWKKACNSLTAQRIATKNYWTKTFLWSCPEWAHGCSVAPQSVRDTSLCQPRIRHCSLPHANMNSRIQHPAMPKL